MLAPSINIKFLSEKVLYLISGSFCSIFILNTDFGAISVNKIKHAYNLDNCSSKIFKIYFENQNIAYINGRTIDRVGKISMLVKFIG